MYVKGPFCFHGQTVAANTLRFFFYLSVACYTHKKNLSKMIFLPTNFVSNHVHWIDLLFQSLKKQSYFFFSCIPQIILTLPFASVFFSFFSSSAFNWEQSAPAFVCFSILYCVWVFFFFHSFTRAGLQLFAFTICVSSNQVGPRASTEWLLLTLCYGFTMDTWLNLGGWFFLITIIGGIVILEKKCFFMFTNPSQRRCQNIGENKIQSQALFQKK